MVSTKKKRSVAKKSTHNKKATSKVVQIDAKKKYGIQQLGPLMPTWAKRNVKNSKGKMVKEWYLKKPSKWLVWVKWEDAFEDDLEKNEDYKCTWSAEEQKLLSENPANKKAIEQAIAEKSVWPWLKRGDEDFSKREELLLSEGYKEWKPKGPSAKKYANKWQLRFAADPKTDTGSNSSDTSDSEKTDNAEDDVEEDDEV